MPFKILMSMEERFWGKVDKNGPIPEYRPDLGPCWIWQGTLDSHGYGVFRIGSRSDTSTRNVKAYRLSYELSIGPIPQDKEMDHLCRNRPCINPLHLEPVARRENILRGQTFAAINAEKSLCPKGHIYDLFNTGFYKGSRYCRRCNNERRARSRNLPLGAI